MYRRIISVILACLLLITMLPAIAESGHRHVQGNNSVKTHKATCTEGGYQYATCEICGKTMWTEPFSPALGHSFSWTVVEPTCTEQGTRTGVCDRCGHTWVGYDDALGHNWGEWTLIEEATPDHPGCRERVCKRCGISEREYFTVDGTEIPVIVIKQVYSDFEDSDSVFAPNEPIYITALVINNSDRDIRLDDVRDLFIDYEYDIAVDTSRPVLAAHSDIAYMYFFTAEDVFSEFTCGELTDYVTVAWSYTDNSGNGTADSNKVTVTVSEVDEPSGITVTKYLFEEPNGEYFVAGENARIGVNIQNDTSDDIIIAMVQDIDAMSDQIVAISSPNLSVASGTLATIVLDYEITEEDAERGYVVDYAIAEIYSSKEDRSASDYYMSNTLTLDCGGIIPSEGYAVEKYPIEDPENGEYFTVGEHAKISIDFVNITDRNIIIESIDDVNVTNNDYISTVGGSEKVLPDERVSCIFEYEITEEDAARGFVTDYAIVYWHYEDEPSEQKSSYSNELTITCTGAAPIIIEKLNVDLEGTVYEVGDKATFRVDITNISDETIHDVYFYDYIVEENSLSYLESSYMDVEPGYSYFMFDYIVQPEDVARGYVTDIIFAWIGEGNNQVISNEVTICCEGEPVELTLTKDLDFPPEKGYYTEGDLVAYDFEFTNDSGIDFVEVTIEDAYISDSVTLEPVEAHTGTKAALYYIVTSEDCENGSKFNVATATAKDANGNTYQVTSNALNVPCGFDPIPEPVNASIAVKKQVISQPLSGERYTPGETVRYLVTVTNTGDVPVYDLNAFDVIYTYYGPVELYGYCSTPLDPGCSYSFTFENTMDYIDCECGEVWDVAHVTYAADNDMGGTEYSNECVIYGEVGTPAAPEKAMLMKYEISTPKLEYYVEGETVSYMVVFYNCTDETLSDVSIYDILSDAPGGLIWNQFTVDPYEVIMVQVDYVVTAIDVDVFGQVSNIAWATAETRSEGKISYTSNEVIVPCGKPHAPVPSHGSSCIKTLVASNNGAELVRTDLCNTHGKLELKAQNMDAASAAAMWERNVYAMYSALISSTGSAAYVTDRDMFLAEINILKGLVGEDDIDLISELLRERATELCYELSRLERRDDLLKPQMNYPMPSLTVNNCVYNVKSFGDKWYQTTASTAAGHLMTQNAADKILTAATEDSVYTSQLLEKANSLWLTALIGEYGMLTRENAAYSADLAMFINSVEARKAALGVIYPDDADLVSGLIIRELRSRTIILCENAK